MWLISLIWLTLLALVWWAYESDRQALKRRHLADHPNDYHW